MVRIIDKTTEAGTTSRALAVQARTLEFYMQVGLADEIVEHGRRARAVNLWVTGRKVAHVEFGSMGAGLSPFPYPLIYPQDEHERLLIERLMPLGVVVERQTELLAFENATDRVVARLKRPDGSIETCEVAYLAGCDGAHSVVREGLKIGFPGGTYQHVFYVADVEATGAAMNGELHVGLDKSDFLALFPLKGEGCGRLVGTVRDDVAEQHDTLAWGDISKRVIGWMDIAVTRVNWFSTYHVHHRVAGHFRIGRAFLLGDAAHVHSPVGGQGMNTGIGDAVNLAWKLAAVLQGRGADSLLDSYEPERIAFARRLVATTDRAFTGVTGSGPLVRFFRLKIVPALFPLLFAIRPMQRLMFRTVSQTNVNYRGSALSAGCAGPVHGGDRLPWVQIASSGGDNFLALSTLDWQLHVYGALKSEMQMLCSARGLAFHVYSWRSEMQEAGLRRDAVYVVRPDGYVGLVEPEGRATAVAAYLDARQIVPIHDSKFQKD